MTSVETKAMETDFRKAEISEGNTLRNNGRNEFVYKIINNGVRNVWIVTLRRDGEGIASQSYCVDEKTGRLNLLGSGISFGKDTKKGDYLFYASKRYSELNDFLEACENES